MSRRGKTDSRCKNGYGIVDAIKMNASGQINPVPPTSVIEAHCLIFDPTAHSGYPTTPARARKGGTARNSPSRGALNQGLRSVSDADVRDWPTTELRWSRHAPPRDRKLAHAIGRVARYRRRIVRKNPGHRRKVAGSVAHRANESDDRRLTFCE